MARRRSSVSTRKSGNTEIVVVEPRAPARRASSRSPTRRRRRGRRRPSTVGGSGSAKKRIIGTAIGGAIYGYVEKNVPSLPSIPVLGKSGTVALACYLIGPRHPIITDVGIAAAAIAGYTLAKNGVISGEWDEE
jgi:hypothetical protein